MSVQAIVCDRLYSFTLFVSATLIIIATLAFDCRVSSRFWKLRYLKWEHVLFRTLELYAKCLVCHGFFWMGRRHPLIVWPFLVSEWILCSAAICRVSGAASWREAVMGYAFVGPNLALFVDNPRFAKSASLLTRYHDEIRVLEVFVFCCWLTISWSLDPERRSNLTPNGFYPIPEFFRPSTYVAFWVGVFLIAQAGCILLRCRLLSGTPSSQVKGSQDRTPSPQNSSPNLTAPSPIMGKPADFDFQRWESTGLGAYLFTKGVGDQFESLLEIICESSEDRLKLSRLRIVRQLGEGGFGRVFEVQDCRHRRGASQRSGVYALKLQRKSAAASVAVREAEMIHELDHMYIVGLVRVFHTNAFYCILMELCEMDLNSRILASVDGMGIAAGLPTTQVKHYSACIALALEHLHHRDFVFRDLKPENVLTTAAENCCDGHSRSHAKLADFGLARSLDPRHLALSRKEFFSMWSGTHAFMPDDDYPEGLQASDPRIRSALFTRDWYAFGCCLVLMLLGERAARTVSHGTRHVLLPLAPETARAQLPERAGACDADAHELVLGLVAEAGQRAGEAAVRACPFLTQALAEAEES
ncbi:unnamed protein product [Prorocentrum cordatum]|uniref:Protein kinase domain-containing protein n=1 Tax=Prorocentrum cordatum TaxID=2364126 RepID=A0ABN9V7G8_9DINO|nr:unnamed protein product [Polarella glacialis]CAK0877588.1 unnamed protein product [Polarella glacialis]